MGEPKHRLATSPPADLCESDEPWRAHLLGLIQLSREFYWEQDESHRYTSVIGPVQEIAGVDPARILGRTRWDIGAALVGVEGGWEAHRSRLEAREPFTDLVLRCLNPSGGVRYFTSHGLPGFDRGGRFTGYRGITRDITQRVQMDLRLGIEHGVSRLRAEADAITRVAPQIIKLICETLGWTCGAFWMRDESNDTVRCVETWGAASLVVDAFLAASRAASHRG